MAIEFSCQCGKKYRVDDRLAGKQVRCKACQAAISVPESAGDWIELPEEPAVSVQQSSLPTQPLPRPTSESVQIGLPEVALPKRGSSTTYASNPALLKVDYRSLLLQDRFTLLSTFLLAGLAIPMLLRGCGVYSGVPVLLALIWFFLSIMPLRGRLAYGCVNPAIIVGADPWRIAIFTDLSTGRGARPSIRIMRAPMQRMTDGPPEVGKPIAVVCTYAGELSSDAWVNFFPTVIQLATSKPEQVKRVMASLKARDWDDLTAAIRRVDVSKDGFYKLWEMPLRNRRRFAIPRVVTRSILAMVWLGLLAIACVVGGDNDGPPVLPQSAFSDPMRMSSRTPGLPDRAPRPGMTGRPATRPSYGPGVSPHKKGMTLEERRRAAFGLPTTGPMATPKDTEIAAMKSVESDETLEKVEILWKTDWWKGRILKRENSRILVHYDGWPSTDDEWVTPDRIRPRK